MKKVKTISDVKINEIYFISDIVKIENETGIDISWFQVGSSRCKITKITNNIQNLTK